MINSNAGADLDPPRSSQKLAEGQASPASKRQNRRAIFASALGTVVEYYDFAIYGYMATFISSLFFHSKDSSAALLGTFATFAVAFFLRVPGGILFGHIGDKYGRKAALSWTILLMCVSTVGIGLLPTYFTLGIWATVLLVLMRCLQGISAGGELGGATAFAAEYAPRKHRGFQVAIVNVGSNAGSLAAAIVALVMTSTFASETILEWAWRVPFILSVPLALVGLWIRAKMGDTPQYDELKSSGEVAKLPLTAIFASHKRSLVTIAGLAAFITGGYYVSSIYAATYLQTEGGLPPQLAFWSTCISLVIGSIGSLVAGRMSDKFGRRPVFFVGAGSGLVLAFPLFALMSSGSFVLAMAGHVLLFLTVAITMAPSFATYAELLTARVRYSGIALGFNSAQMLLGGTAPFLCTWLIGLTGSSVAPAGYFMFCAVFTVTAAFFLRETSGSELRVD
ncbi:MFS transporter [Arthrobacter sp. I2-34]|uniref:MFS transporter n=1 Tax=Arthrobacter hankyongi TaxID=2904801 RepID=A0ABS9LER3_9MICC|nr:MFS transporter [Arthrobacter hankyongi]MCG2624944.1 MFS transporter [Arthrobacter hankyongi]